MVLSKPKNLTNLWYLTKDEDGGDDKHWLYLPTLAGVKYVEVWTNGRGRNNYHWKVSRSSGRHSSGKNVTFDVAKSQALSATQKSRTSTSKKTTKASPRSNPAARKPWHKALTKRSSTRNKMRVFKGRSPSTKSYDGLDWVATAGGRGMSAERHGVEFDVGLTYRDEVDNPTFFGAWWSRRHDTMIFLQANHVSAVIDYWKIKTKLVCDLLMSEHDQPGCSSEITGTGERWVVDIGDLAASLGGVMTWEMLITFARDEGGHESYKTDSWKSRPPPKRRRR